MTCHHDVAMRPNRLAVMLFGLVGACSPGGDCTCALKGVIISSATTDLVGATGCGHAVSCTAGSPCNGLLLPPPNAGGACDVGVLFADGGSQVVSVDFGALHHSTDCCGDFFDHSTVTVDVQ